MKRTVIASVSLVAVLALLIGAALTRMKPSAAASKTPSAALPDVPMQAADVPPDGSLDSIVLIRVGDRVTGTGVGMDDDAASIVTSIQAVNGNGNGQLTVEYRHDGFRRAAMVVASETSLGLVVLWPVGGAPRHPASTEIAMTRTGDDVLLLGHVVAPENASVEAIAYGRMTVCETADSVMRRKGVSPQGFMVVESSEPLGGPGRPTPGMAIFSEETGRLVGIVSGWNGDPDSPSFTVIPASAIDVALRVVEESR